MLYAKHVREDPKKWQETPRATTPDGLLPAAMRSGSTKRHDFAYLQGRGVFWGQKP